MMYLQMVGVALATIIAAKATPTSSNPTNQNKSITKSRVGTVLVPTKYRQVQRDKTTHFLTWAKKRFPPYYFIFFNFTPTPVILRPSYSFVFRKNI
jgi:hypothetical protein